MGRIDRQYIEKLKELQKMDDEEEAHIKADTVLCELLEELTYTEVVAEYRKIDKFYS